MLRGIGSIVIRADPVKNPAPYLLNLSPMGLRGYAEARFENYSPQDRAEGYYWSAVFRIYSRETILKELYENGLNRIVEVWGYGLEPDFEGYIEEIVFNLPPDQFTISLRGVSNKAHMRADTDDDGTVDRSDVIESTESQTLYGEFEGVLSGGQLESSGVADQAVQSHINLRGLPSPSANFMGGAREMFIEVFVRGYITTLDRRLYNQTDEVGSQSLSSQISTVLDAIGEFIESHEETPNTTSVTKEYDIDRRGFDLVMDLPRLGDSLGNRYLLGCYGRNCTGVHGRKAKLTQASPVVPPPVEG